MAGFIKATLCAAALTCAGQAGAATITYNTSCMGFCYLDKVNGTVSSVRLEGSLRGYQSFFPIGIAERPSVIPTYNLSGTAFVSGGNAFAFNFNQTAQVAAEISFIFDLSFDQIITANLSRFEGTGVFEAGGYFTPAYSYVSGDYRIGQQSGGRPISAPLRVTIDYTPAVPEPSTWALMLTGFGILGYSLRRRPKLAFA